MKKQFKSLLLLLCVAFTVVSYTSCDKKEIPEKPIEKPIEKPAEKPEEVKDDRLYHIAIALGKGGNGGTIVQSTKDLTKGKITFKGFGLQLPSKRTSRVFSSSDGKSMYMLNYGGGELIKYKTIGGQDYEKESEINVEPVLGTGYCRQAMVSDKEFVVYNAEVKNLYKDKEGTDYDYASSTTVIARVGLDGNMTMHPKSQFETPRTEEDIRENLAVWRMDGAIVHGNKIYLGVAKSSYDKLTGKEAKGKIYSASTLILDYPSLKNPKMISSGIATGETYGYRTAPSFADEKGDIYQVSYGSGHISKISNDKYDDSYNFKLSDKLGIKEAGALGIFYAGNGIAYVPFFDAATGKNSDPVSQWGVARIDLKKQTAIKMNIPGHLWLRQYQKSVVGKDGKFYMALAPIGQQGHIYIFDPKSESPDGFTLGAELEGGGEQFYIGIY